MLLYSRTNAEMFKYLLIHFVQKYINPEYMGQDAVFVHLFEKYINTGQAEFFTEKYPQVRKRPGLQSHGQSDRTTGTATRNDRHQ